MFLYEFDLFGILYTVAIAALSILLIVASVVFAVRKSSRGGATIAFRVLDIILFVLLCILWVLFAFSKAGWDKFNVSADLNGALVISVGTGSFAVPFIGEIVYVWSTVLGILLLSLVTLLSVLSFVFSFVFRRPARKCEENDGMPSADEYYDESTPSVNFMPASEIATEETETPVAQNVAEEVTETPAPESITEETEISVAQDTAEETDVPAVQNVTEETETPAPENTIEETVTPAPESATEETETSVAQKQDFKIEPIKTEKETTEEVRSYDYIAEKRGTSGKVYSSALQRPGVKKKSDKERTARPVTETPAAPPKAKAVPQKVAEVKAPRVREEGTLPVTRRLVITNRLNVVNIFNDYLKEKDENDRKKLSESIEQIELGEK